MKTPRHVKQMCNGDMRATTSPGKERIGHWGQCTLVLSQPCMLVTLTLCRSKSGPQRVSDNPSHRVLSNTPTSQPTIKVSTAESHITTMPQTPLACPSTKAITHHNCNGYHQHLSRSSDGHLNDYPAYLLPPHLQQPKTYTTPFFAICPSINTSTDQNAHHSSNLLKQT